ncbi:MAG: YaiI/YqxD family protein [Hyphomonadaceae bacterium]
MGSIYVDADACPVKEEVYRVARRVGFEVLVVANAFIRTPSEPRIRFVLVDAGPDVADDWIAERAGRGDVVVTNDIPLAGRALENGAEVISPTARVFTHAMIGSALATRGLMEHLRSFGEQTSGPPPFSQRDRSAFLSALDAAIVRAKRAGC